ncbi:MAG: hypothetical protein QXF80_06825 [Thermoplasmatales archaeon]
MVDVLQTRTERGVLNNVYEDSSNAIKSVPSYSGIFTANVNVSSTVQAISLSKPIVLEAIWISGQATAETDTVSIVDSAGNVYYSWTASAIIGGGALLPSGLNINIVGSGSVIAGKVNLLGYYP